MNLFIPARARPALPLFVGDASCLRRYRDLCAAHTTYLHPFPGEPIPEFFLGGLRFAANQNYRMASPLTTSSRVSLFTAGLLVQTVLVCLSFAFVQASFLFFE